MRIFPFSLLLICFLTGCGFYLRKPPPIAFDKVALHSSGCLKFEYQLSTFLESNQITVLNTQATQAPILTMSCPVLTTQPLVYDAEGQLRRERLYYTLTGNLTRSEKTDAFELKTLRERQLNTQQTLADETEKTILIKEMQEELFYRLLNKLSEFKTDANHRPLP